MSVSTRIRFRHVLRVVSINIGLIVLGLAAIELIFGHWSAGYVVRDPRLIGRAFQFEQKVYEPHGLVTYTRDEFGLRTRQRSPAVIDLVTIGGSTTAQTFISDGETWQDIIEARTGIVVANAGVDGMGLQSVPEMLEDLLQKIPGLKAKYFLYYLGVNDAAMAQTVSVTERKKKFAWTLRIRGRSAIWQAIAHVKERFMGPHFLSHLAVAPAPVHDMVLARTDLAPISTYVATMYAPELRGVLDTHRRRGEVAILVTQSANPALVGRQDGAVTVARPDFAQWAVALDQINTATGVVCGEYVGTCRFINLAGALAFEPSDFYDLVHNTPQGARKIGEFLARRIAFIRGDAPSAGHVTNNRP